MSLHSQPQLQIYGDNSVRRHCTRLCLRNYCNCQWKERSFQILQIWSCENENSKQFIHNTWRLLSLLPFSDIVSMLLPRLPNAFLSICSITHSEKSNVWRSNTINSAIQINIIQSKKCEQKIILYCLYKKDNKTRLCCFYWIHLKNIPHSPLTTVTGNARIEDNVESDVVSESLPRLSLHFLIWLCET